MKHIIRSLALGLFSILFVACTPQATPEVIRDTSAAQTRTAAAIPRPTSTLPPATPYIRPTDNPMLDLNTLLIRIGTETITLGQYRNRVRYERFFSLDGAQRLIQRIGLDVLLKTPLEKNPTLQAVIKTLNSVLDTQAFGQQVYDSIVREAVIRQEIATRNLQIPQRDIDAYWIRQLDLQNAPQVNDMLPKAREDFISKAVSYSGLSHDEVVNAVQAGLLSDVLRPVIINEVDTLPNVLQFKLRYIVTSTQAEADSALTRLKSGEDFRKVACEVSIDPLVRGKPADTNYVTRGQFMAGVQNVDAVFQAAKGDIVGPLESPAGWYVFLILDQRKNADGDSEVLTQHILVATDALAKEVKDRASKGEDFNILTCLYSLDASQGVGGDLGIVNPDTLPTDISKAVSNSQAKALLGPFKTDQGYEIFLVEDRQMRILKPAELEQAQAQAFTNWEISKMSAADVQAVSDVWKDSIPADPNPEDVSPLLRTERYSGLLKATSTP